MKYLKHFESNTEVDNYISIIESILDDHLDEYGEPFSFTIEPSGKDLKIFLELNGAFTLANGTGYKNEPYPILKSIYGYYNSSKNEHPFNDISTFQKIYKLTGLKVSHLKTPWIPRDITYGTGTPPPMYVELKLSQPPTKKTPLRSLMKYMGFKNENLINDLKNNNSIIETILDDYLDSVDHAFSFELTPITNSIANKISDTKQIIILTIYYKNWINRDNCSILKTLSDHFRNAGSSFGSEKKDVIQHINNTQPFQKICKLTGFKLTSFNFQSFGPNPHVDLKLEIPDAPIMEFNESR